MDGFEVEYTEDDGIKVLNIAGEMTIAHAARLRTVLLDAIEGAGHVAVEIEKVSAIDLTGLQLLCSAHRTACQRGGTFELLSVEQSEAVAEAAGIAGLLHQADCSGNEGKRCIWTGGGE